MKAVICLEKFSDWLEAYTIFVYYPMLKQVKLLYIENERNNKNAVESLFKEFKADKIFQYESCDNRDEFFSAVNFSLLSLQRGDVLAAPFVRYRTIWSNVRNAKKKGITTIHLSESLPDSFGRLGYRLGFRLVGGFNMLGFFKQLLSVPIMYLYALTHKPDICFYNMAPAVKNPFVKNTIRAAIPSLDLRKKEFLNTYLKNEKRILLISGFGYDLQKMVDNLKLDKYIATSKNKEIIIDGKPIPLNEFICAEEVLLTGLVKGIIGYDSTAMCWAYRLGDVDIKCYHANKLSRQYGFMFGPLAKRTLKKCGVQLFPENKEFVNR